MITLIEQAVELRPRMRHVKEAEAGEVLTRQLSEVDEALRAHWEELARLSSFVAAMRERGLLPENFNGTLNGKALQEKLTTLRERLTSDPQTIFKNSRWATAKTLLVNSAKGLRDSLLNIWGKYLDGLTPPLDELRDLIQSDVLGNQFRRIGQLRDEINVLRLALPISVAEIDLAAAKGDEVKQLAANLDFKEVPLEVKRFLKDVFLRSVSLADLDPGVHAWLIQKKLATSFRITSNRGR
jgi:hypothetical protein